MGMDDLVFIQIHENLTLDHVDAIIYVNKRRVS